MTTVGVDTGGLSGVGACPIGCGVGVSVASGAIASRVASTAPSIDIAFTVAAAASSTDTSELTILYISEVADGVQADRTATVSSETSVSSRSLDMRTP